MKRIFIAAGISVILASCGAANSANVQPPAPSAYKALEVTTGSNSDRIAKLEQELDQTNSDLETLRSQNKQLADSYDTMVKLFKEHKQLTLTLIQKMNTVLDDQKKSDATEKAGTKK